MDKIFQDWLLSFFFFLNKLHQCRSFLFHPNRFWAPSNEKYSNCRYLYLFSKSSCGDKIWMFLCNFCMDNLDSSTCFSLLCITAFFLFWLLNMHYIFLISFYQHFSVYSKPHCIIYKKIAVCLHTLAYK